VKKDNLIAYHKYALRLLDKLETIQLEHVPISANNMANALANLVATLAFKVEESITVSIYGQWVITSLEDGNEEEVKTISAYEIDKEGQGQLLIDYSESFLFFSIIRGLCISALSLVSGCNAWMTKKDHK